MGHTHDHGPANHDRAFTLGVALNVAFVVIEIIFGVLSHSLALVADAGHNLSDVLGLLVAWGAAVLSRRRPTLRHTYGMRRSSILAAVVNAVVLLIAIGAITVEALRRFGHPEPVTGRTVIAVALVGITVNTATALLFMRGRKADLNIRGAFLHMAADAAVSLGVVLAGIAILITGQQWIDPVVSLIIAAVLLVGSWRLLCDSLNLALDAVPEEIDAADVRTYLATLPGVVDVHDLHIWGMSTTEAALTAHLVAVGDARSDDALLQRIGRELHNGFGIEHATVQVEHGEHCDGCPLTPAAPV
jgi:cobalt-zinc-cadmium efflux system protein